MARAVVKVILKFASLQGNPVDRPIVRPTLLNLRIKVGTAFYKKVWVSRGVFPFHELNMRPSSYKTTI